MNVPELMPLPDVTVDAASLRDGAHALRAEARRAEERYEEARDAWRLLREAYRHDGTEERVWAGLDLIEAPLSDWQTALSRAADRTDEFATEAGHLSARRAALEGAASVAEWRRALALGSERPLDVVAAMAAVDAYNRQVVDLETDWHRCQEEYAADVRGIQGGEDAGLALSEGAVRALDWDGLRAEVAGGMKAGHPDWLAEQIPQILTALTGVDTDGFLAWVERHPRAAAAFLSSTEFIRWVGDHPEVAAELVKRDFPRDPVPGSPEAVMARFVNDPATVDPATSREDVVAAHDAWHSLSAADQAVLLLSYPDVFGNMNGVPFEQRAQIGALTVRGHLAVVTAAKTERESKDTWEERIPGYEELGSRTWAHPKAYVPGYEDEDARRRAQEEWLLEGVQLEQNRTGLRDAWQQYVVLARGGSQEREGQAVSYRTVFVDTTGAGRIATMQGTPSPQIERVGLFVPGTFTTAQSVHDYNTDLDAMTGGSPDTTVAFYWAGTDFPGSYDPSTGKQVMTSVVTDNMTTRWSDMGAPRVAAFDQAMDLELGHAEQTTLAHSAGNSITGAAEKPEHGMTTDKVGYLAPTGSGPGVDSPDDTVNPHAERAVVQTREDPIRYVQRYAARLHGGDPAVRMGAVRLETGYTGDSTAENPVRVGERPNGGHSSLTEPGTISLANIRAFFFGEPVVEELPAVLDATTVPDRPRIIDGLEAHPEITTSDGFNDFKKPYSEVFP